MNKKLFLFVAFVAIIIIGMKFLPFDSAEAPTCGAGELSSMSGNVLVCTPTCTQEYASANYMEPVVAVCNKHITVNSDEANRLEEYMQSVISDTKAKQALLKDANDNLRAVRDTKTKAINEQIAEDKVAFPKESQTP